MQKKVLLCAAVCAAATHAAEAADAAAPDSVVNLKALEVVSNRATVRTPVAFTNVTKSQIERTNDGRDIPYLLGMTPSLITTSDAGAGVGYTSLRVRGTDGSRINVTANGIPVNDPESHNVYWVNLPDLASSLRDIQIQRGAGTSTNGPGAFGASINMLTDTPADASYSSLTASYGSYNSYKATLRVGTGLICDRWAADLRLSRIASDGYIDRAHSSLWSYFGQLAYRHGGTSVRLMAFGGHETTYMAWDYASKEQMEEYGRRYNPCGEYTASDGSTAYYKNQNDNYGQYHFQLHLAQMLGEYWRLNAALHFTKGRGYYEQYKTRRTLVEYGLEPYIADDGSTVKKSDLIRLKNMDNGFGGGTFALNYNRDRIDGTLGAGIHNFRGHHFGQVAWVRNYIGALDPLQEYYRNLGEKFDANVYARVNYEILPTLSAYVDLQYRHINYSITGASDTYDYNTGDMQVLDIHRKYDFFNPKAGLTWQKGANRAYASWAVAHKEPVRDNFTDGDPRHMPRLERMMDYEFGYFYANGLLTAGANFYMMDYRDQLVVTGQLSDTGNALSVNVPSSYRMGVELQWALRPARWFDWQLNLTLSRNRIKDFVEYIYEDGWTNPISIELGNTPIAFSPDIVLHNAFNFHWRGFEATIDSRYVSKQYLTNARNDEQVLDPYFVTDLHLAYNFGSVAGIKDLRCGISVYNVFSEKYENNGYAGSGYYVGADGKPVIYRYSGYAAQAPANLMATVAFGI